ncbi:hypothetical protein RUM43_014608 [Polyplax serrata]|uniref:Uncharacterized protein n=1 Tax=Polyplax serrata TaxID=468196 RepID=A0AAN8Q228_POLSC
MKSTREKTGTCIFQHGGQKYLEGPEFELDQIGKRIFGMRQVRHLTLENTHNTAHHQQVPLAGVETSLLVEYRYSVEVEITRAW